MGAAEARRFQVKIIVCTVYKEYRTEDKKNYEYGEYLKVLV